MSVVIRLRTEGDPEIEVHASDALDASQQLKELRDAGAFSALKTIGREYKEAPAAGLESVHTEFPEARVIAEAEMAEAPMISAVSAQPAASMHHCEKCGKPAVYRKGTSAKNGPWEGYFCSSNDRTHTKFLK